jgi:hypothetical protein
MARENYENLFSDYAPTGATSVYAVGATNPDGVIVKYMKATNVSPTNAPVTFAAWVGASASTRYTWWDLITLSRGESIEFTDTRMIGSLQRFWIQGGAFQGIVVQLDGIELTL